MFHSTLAARRGLAASDEKALDVLLRDGPLTHAQLVERTSLAPASVSDLIDRLEAKGYVRRSPHPADRRRVLVTADNERIFADVSPLFADWVRSLGELYASYSDAELNTIRDFLTRAAARQRTATEKLVRTDTGG